MIARTETIRAHHQGSIATYAEAGVYGVEVMAETMTVSGDAENFEEMHVCPECAALQERTRAEPITLEEALPLIPVHPNCMVSGQTPIYTSKSWVPIGKIKPGALVMTHKGRFRKVTKIHHTKADRPKVVILTFGIYKRISMTSNHPLLVNGQWQEAGSIKEGDLVEVLAHRCPECQTLTPYWKQYCCHTCQSKVSAREMWSTPGMKDRVSQANRKSMLNQYATGVRIPDTTNARKGVAHLFEAGTHPLQTLDRRGDKNWAKNPAVRKKISESKMGDKNPSRQPGAGAAHSKRMKAMIKAHPEKHINALMAKKARLKNEGLTWIERSMQIELNALGLFPEYNHGVEKLWVDFGFVDKKIAVECDGEQWHQDVKKEKARDARLEKAGWTVLHFTGKQIHADAKACAAEVYRVVCNHKGMYEYLQMPITKVTHFRHSQAGVRLFNLTVAEDESYVAKGVVVHNCRCVVVPKIMNEDEPLETDDEEV